MSGGRPCARPKENRSSLFAVPPDPRAGRAIGRCVAGRRRSRRRIGHRRLVLHPWKRGCRDGRRWHLVETRRPQEGGRRHGEQQEPRRRARPPPPGAGTGGAASPPSPPGAATRRRTSGGRRRSEANRRRVGRNRAAPAGNPPTAIRLRHTRASDRDARRARMAAGRVRCRRRRLVAALADGRLLTPGRRRTAPIRGKGPLDTVQALPARPPQPCSGRVVAVVRRRRVTQKPVRLLRAPASAVIPGRPRRRLRPATLPENLGQKHAHGHAGAHLPGCGAARDRQRRPGRDGGGYDPLHKGAPSSSSPDRHDRPGWRGAQPTEAARANRRQPATILPQLPNFRRKPA